MQAKFSQWLAPTSQDSRLAEKQRLLNFVLFGLALPSSIATLILIVLVLLHRSPIAIAGAGLGMLLSFILSYWLGRKEKIYLAAYIPILGIFVSMVTMSAFMGVGHVTYLGFAMATVAAGILISSSVGILFAFLSAVAHLGVGVLQNYGAIPTSLTPQNTLLADAVGLGFGLAILVLLVNLYQRESSLAGQQEQALIQKLQAEKFDLEKRVTKRSDELKRRLNQIRTAAEISRSISSELNVETLLEEVVNLIKERFHLYYVGVFLIDAHGEYAVLQAGTGEAGRRMLAEKHKLAVSGDSMVGWATANRKARIALDVGQEAVRFSNPHLQETKSELALPLSTRKESLGALTIQSSEQEAFDQDDITVLQGIADSLAASIEKARLFNQVQENLREIQSLHRQYLEQAWTQYAARSEEAKAVAEPDSAAKTQVGKKSPDPIEVPIQIRQQVIGNIQLEMDRASLTQEEQALVEAVAGQAALALENARLLEETRRRAERENLATRMATRIWSRTSVENILRTGLLELGNSLNAAEGTIRLDMDRNPETDREGEVKA
ncbi:MAG: GAF domain-containing protein [Anaerolineales bacterium]